MTRKITQRQLQNESGEIVRALDRGESFVLTRNGVPVGELSPLRQRRLVPAGTALAAFHGAQPVDLARFRKDMNAVLDHGSTPRG
jgi:antitoxin (DNA-binding transcriptional repressor) of toxin-antitoxin stability system